MKAFRTSTEGLGGPAGTVCYPFAGHDYGLASDDTCMTGRLHKSYTLKMFGGGPSFTHPADDVEEIEVPALEPPDDEHVRTVCLLGQGTGACRYLTSGRNGWSCEKLSYLASQINCRTDMIAKGDNCEGRGPR